MPRKARIDAPGALHHVIARGIGRRKTFNDNKDRDNFVERLETVLKPTRTGCFAWALVPNLFDVAVLFYNDVKLFWSPGKKSSIVKARSLLCYWSVNELACACHNLHNDLCLSVTAVSHSLEHGKHDATEKNFELEVQNIKR